MTEFGKRKYIEGGYAEKRISVKPNFSYPPDPEWDDGTGKARSGALFVGHLLPWKGIAMLMEAWRNIPTPLRVAGSGPLQHLVAAADKHNVTELGLLDAKEVYGEMRRASFLVFSSIWYECFPLTFIEAFAAGLPIIAAKLGLPRTSSRIVKRVFISPPAIRHRWLKRLLGLKPTRTKWRAWAKTPGANMKPFTRRKPTMP